MTHAQITFLPADTTVTAEIHSSLLAAARRASVSLEAPCDGKGTCGKCRVHVEGETAAPHHDELRHLGAAELEDGVRLACRTTVAGRAVVRPLDTGGGRHRIVSDGVLPPFELDPAVTKRCITLAPPSLEEGGDDLARLGRALGASLSGEVPLPLLRALPGELRRGGGTVTAVFADGRPVGVEAGDTAGAILGVAVDIGTTTVVASLVDLVAGREVATASLLNPQKEYGLDVLTRIRHLKEHPDALERLCAAIREGVDRLVGELCADAGIDRRAVYEVAVAANTTMTHIFLGVDPAGLGSAPYLPAFTAAVTIPAAEAGLAVSPFGRVHCLPAVSGYIGGDICAGLLASKLADAERPALLIDIGTNGEIVLGSRAGLHACSCAAGPALEGMNVSCGMRAAEGAIERVEIDGDVQIATIGGAWPVGICGSGIIDAVAEMARVGAILPSGRFASPSGEPLPWHGRLRREGGSRFVLAEDREGREIAVTQRDVRQVQLAKGAILSGILALTDRLGVSLADLDRVYIAGAFGSHVRKESLARLGLIPAECLDRVETIGNSSKTGAVLALLSRGLRREAEELAGRVAYLELSCLPGYDRLFADSLSFPAAS